MKSAWVQTPSGVFKNHLLSGLITDQINQIVAEADAEIQEAYRFTHNSPLPQPDELLNYVYR
jgi:TPP-dependent pyruvate/acetoin dehydrogenase alpha subunit